MNDGGVITVALILVAVLVASFFVGSSLAGQQAQTDKGQAAQKPSPSKPIATALSWDSDRVRAMAQRIEDEKWARVARDRVEIETERAFSDALKEKFSKEELHELAASFDSTPMKWEDWTRFQNLLHEALLDTFLGLGDREGLVQLLSVRCLKEAHLHTDIEFLLVLRGDKLKDPILVLGEAYSRSRTPEWRREIAAAVRRAFGGNAIGGRDDAQLVANAVAWYRAHRDELAFNISYGDNSMDSRVRGDQYVKNPLFVRNAPREKRPSGKRAGAAQ